MEKVNLKGIKWTKVGAIAGLSAFGIATVTTTSIIAHELIVSNDSSLKITKVETIGELDVDSTYRLNTLYVRVNFNKPVTAAAITTDASNEHFTYNPGNFQFFNSESELVYINGNKIEIALRGGYVSSLNSEPDYQLSGPIVTRIAFKSANEVGYKCEINWFLNFCYWNESQYKNMAGQHVQDLSWTTDPRK